MTFKLYDTLSRSLTDFKPIRPGRASLYVCGPTVYDHAHIGHARASVAFDVLARHLKASGHELDYVRNYTDIDDKIIVRARERGLDWKEMAEGFIKSFSEDMAELNCLEPTRAPRATEYIQEMLDDISKIVENGHAYVLDGDVYFDVASLESYGRLSGREIESAEPGARVEVNDRKKNPADFALWKASKPGEPSWPSPWGPGRPGWHIECSTMSAKLLGDSFDIHGGGQDLVFPHHENEMAQSAALGRPMANIWTHNGFVNINREKMSKSLGNTFNVKEIFKLFPPEVLRFFLLSSHYRGPVDFSDEALRESSRGLERIYRTVEAAFDFLGIPGDGAPSELPTTDGEGEIPEAAVFREKFSEALDDDLNTSGALGHLFDAVRLLNKKMTAGDKTAAKSLLKVLFSFGDELGLKFSEPRAFLKRFGEIGLARFKGETENRSPELIEEMVAEREKARSRKDWTEADRLRDELAKLGVVLEDKGAQTSWRFS
ncbi:MAG: cysteine--tRNA ligase [Deltaproteobacteria bacterium]|jgi:cysteinyl-tRNA synthetase|nr:cysteine--tRNA ligase [Deltaproteobacteria bacterium]